MSHREFTVLCSCKGKTALSQRTREESCFESQQEAGAACARSHAKLTPEGRDHRWWPCQVTMPPALCGPPAHRPLSLPAPAPLRPSEGRSPAALPLPPSLRHAAHWPCARRRGAGLLPLPASLPPPTPAPSAHARGEGRRGGAPRPAPSVPRAVKKQRPRAGGILCPRERRLRDKMAAAVPE